jgi:hypothetical protein
MKSQNTRRKVIKCCGKTSCSKVVPLKRRKNSTIPFERTSDSGQSDPKNNIITVGTGDKDTSYAVDRGEGVSTTKTQSKASSLDASSLPEDIDEKTEANMQTDPKLETTPDKMEISTTATDEINYAVSTNDVTPTTLGKTPSDSATTVLENFPSTAITLSTMQENITKSSVSTAVSSTSKELTTAQGKYFFWSETADFVSASPIANSSSTAAVTTSKTISSASTTTVSPSPQSKPHYANMNSS